MNHEQNNQQMDAPQQPNTSFNWAVYADATCAGLSVLIPIPVVDWLFEEFFRRRMPGAIASRRERRLEENVVRELNRGDPDRNCLLTCLLLPFIGIYWLIKKISRTILYFLSVKEAADKVSLYWYQAFLINYMLSLGHLEHQSSAKAARQAMWQSVKTVHSSPVLQLARQVVSGSRHILRSLLRFRRGEEDEVIAEKKSKMVEAWNKYSDHFKALGVLYRETYQARLKEIKSA